MSLSEDETGVKLIIIIKQGLVFPRPLMNLPSILNWNEIDS